VLFCDSVYTIVFNLLVSYDAILNNESHDAILNNIDYDKAGFGSITSTFKEAFQTYRTITLTCVSQ
jgi:hypothetical protein